MQRLFRLKELFLVSFVIASKALDELDVRVYAASDYLLRRIAFAEPFWLGVLNIPPAPGASQGAIRQAWSHLHAAMAVYAVEFLLIAEAFASQASLAPEAYLDCGVRSYYPIALLFQVFSLCFADHDKEGNDEGIYCLLFFGPKSERFKYK